MRSPLLSIIVIILSGSLFYNCKTKNGPKVLPTVSTTAISEVTDSSATIRGNVADEGSNALVKDGVCWSLISQPTLIDSYLVSGPIKGDFEFHATDFKNNTTYFVRAFASNDDLITYGNELSFKTKPGWVLKSPVSDPYISCVLNINDTTLLIGTHSGIFRSFDNGNSWTYSSNFPGNPKINCLLEVGNIICAGTETGALKSYDNGLNWTKLGGNGSNSNFNIMASGDNNYVYAGTTNGVFVLALIANTWNQKSSLPGFTNISLLTVLGDKVFAGSKSTKEIYRSLDQGGTWTKLPKDFSSDMPTGIVGYSPKLIVATSTGIFYSYDNGMSFEKDPGFTGSLFSLGVSDGLIVAGGEGKTESMYLSKDFGNSYLQFENPGDNTVSVSSVAANKKFLFAVSGNKLYRMRL